MGKCVTLVDGHGVGHTISGIKHETGGSTGGVEGKHGLDGEIVGRDFESLEHDLCHFFPVGFGISGG